MSRATESDPGMPVPGQPDTVTISTQQYRLLIDIAETVIKMGSTLEASNKPKGKVGFQSPSSRLIPEMNQLDEDTMGQGSNIFEIKTITERAKPPGWATADQMARNSGIQIKKRSSGNS